MFTWWTTSDERLTRALRYPDAVARLLVRLFIAWVFFKSGLLKIESWSTTLELFEYEYAVPLLSPRWAACLGTAAELILPPLLALGLFTRPAAFALIVFNAVAAISYPDLSPAGLKDHHLWGLGLAWIFFAGAGPLSADRLMHRLRGTNRA